MSVPGTRPEIRDAATVVVLRRDGGEARILMGQRGASAAFMPSKFVFPGGAVDPADFAVADRSGSGPADAARLSTDPRPESPAGIAAALAMAAIRETWEETGLAIARPAEGPAPAIDHPTWGPFFGAGLVPAPECLRFIFRAITPPGRPRRFDARFFIADASAVTTPLDDFSRAEDELTHLSWLPLSEARALDLPFITEVVLAEIAAGLETAEDRPVPFFRHEGGRSHLLAL